MTRPMIQIDDLVREMTEEEHAAYLAQLETQSENPYETPGAS
jgi:hypothetical protein